jgi:glycosyltransferase involved in cell wall biosynthesis
MKTDRRIKILHVLFTLDPGGMENGVVNVARALPAERFEIHVCCLERSGAFAQRLPHPENVYELCKPPGFSPRAVLSLAGVIRRVQPHVVHSHNLGPMIYSVLATGLGRWRPVLQGEHTLLTDWERAPRRLRQRRWGYRCCARVHTVSHNVRRDLIELGFPAGRIVTLLNGVDSAKFQPGEPAAARRRLGLPETGVVLGMVGRFAPGKGHETLIPAFERFAATRPAARLLLIGGGGSEEEHIRRLATATRVADRIHFTGHRDDLPVCYQAMDLLVFASLHEGLSNAVLEAKACGVPTLAHPAAGNLEVLKDGHNCLLRELHTVEKFEAALEEAMSQPERLRGLGRVAREEALREFSLQRMVGNYQRIYEELSPPD